MYRFFKNKVVMVAFLSAFCLASVQSVFALKDGLCLTPPMGWNSWNYYRCSDLNEKVVLDVANAFLKKHPANWEGKQISLKDAGYVYINLDDCYAITARTAAGRLQVNTVKFPHCTQSSMVWLADTIHKLGLKIGYYSCAGTMTCAKTQAGGYLHEELDAQTYAQWKGDYLKYDYCNVPDPISTGQSGLARAPVIYSKMSHALKAATADSARKIIFSICCPDEQPWLWGDSCGHLWRTTWDIGANWGSVNFLIDQQLGRQVYRYAKPGNWADNDMLEVGNGDITPVENQSHFDIWCNSASPLIMGNAVPEMSEAVFTILTNREVIAVDQDSLGVTGRRLRSVGNMHIHVKKMGSKDTVALRKYAVVLFNKGEATANGVFKWSDMGETNTKAVYTVRDLWLHKVLDSMKTDSISLPVVSHGTRHLLVTRNPIVGISRPAREDPALLSDRIAARTTPRGVEIFVPAANSSVRIFDVKGRVVAAFAAEKTGWRNVNAGRAIRGTFLVRVETADGSITTKAAIVK